MRIAIVGNSPILLEKELGSEIDNHDIVVRFNRFITNGYEKHTGKKVDYWVLSWYWEPQSDFYLNMDLSHILIAPRNSNIELSKKTFDEKFKNKISFNDVTLINYDKYVKSIKKKLGTDKNPTTGFIGIEYFLQNFPDAEYDIYGFDFCKDPNNQHYFEHFENKSIYHEVDKEEKYFWDVLNKKIKYHK